MVPLGEDENINALKNILGCKVGCLPMSLSWYTSWGLL